MTLFLSNHRIDINRQARARWRGIVDKVSVLQIARVKSFLNLSTTSEIERMLWYDSFFYGSMIFFVVLVCP